MKVLIDLPQDVLEHPHNYCCYSLANQIKGKYTPIPDNATNGDVITTMLNCMVLGVTNGKVYIEHVYFPFDEDWWNAPYMRNED